MQEAEVSDSDEEAALLFYKGIEERLKLKRKNKKLPEDGWEINNDHHSAITRLNRVNDLTDRYPGTLIVSRLMMEQQEAEEEAEMDGEAKRGITYQVQWNCLWKRNGPYVALALFCWEFLSFSWETTWIGSIASKLFFY